MVDIERNLCDCIERIEKLFFYDTLVLLDCVLADDRKEPEYSANSVYQRLEECLLFQNLYFQDQINSVSDFLKKNGYSDEDVDLLSFKKADEAKRYEGL